MDLKIIRYLPGGQTGIIRNILIFYLGFALLAAPLKADDSFPDDLTELSLEALMNIKVTTVSRKAEKLSDAAAAIYVITQKDIRRSGATTIPELLRTVPGMQVAKIDANKWAVTSRGFNGRFANKLLVLVDGRSVYSPLFSGVFWACQDTFLEDIERIEIIRGPGATLWGANAVNGVINIISKNAKETQGGLVTGIAGTEEQLGGIRYGGLISDKTHYRIYAKGFKRDSNVDADGDDSADDWKQWRSGFRTDHTLADNSLFTFQGDLFQGDSGETATNAVLDSQYPYFTDITKDHRNEIFGANFLGRWRRTISESSDLAIQAYYDHSENNIQIIDTTVDTYDFDFQHRFQPFKNNSIIWGVGYRYIEDKLTESFSISLEPASQSYDLISAFIQDDITIVPKRLRLTLGSKVENNDFSGTEWQPSARILWTPDSGQSVWAAISRAVRTPSRGEVDNRVRMSISEGNPLLIETRGNKQFKSEEVIAYELGYRIQPRQNVSIDLSTFYNNYDKLRSSRIQDPVFNPPPQPSVLPNQVENKMKGNSYGVELALDWWPVSVWRLQLAYTYFELDLWTEKILYQFTESENGVPKHQSSLRSSFDLTEKWQLDLWARYVDELETITKQIDSYVEVDARIGWQVRPNLEIAFVGLNLLDSHHLEYVAEYLVTQYTEVQRSMYAKITYKF